MTSRWVTTSDGVRVHVVDSGGPGRAVVLVPGFTADTSSWVFQMDALAAAGARVVALDPRSHGRSDAPPHGQRMARHGMDLHEVLTALDVSDALLVGASMGASTVWAYLDLVGDAVVAGVVSVDQTPRMRAADDWPYGFYGLDDVTIGTFFSGGIPDTGRGPSPQRQRESAQRWLDRLGVTPAAMGEIRPETLPLLADHAHQDWRDVVARTSVPVLAVAGRDSQFWPAGHAEALAALAPRGQALVLEDCGHVVQLDQPDVLSERLLEFLADLPE